MTLPGLGQMNSPYERRSKPDSWPDHVCQAGRGARTDRGLSGGSDADEAERCGWINRALPDAELDDFVAGLARRIALFPADAVRATKQVLNELTLPATDAFRADVKRFQHFVASDAVKARTATLFGQGLQTRGDLERELGSRIGTL